MLQFWFCMICVDTLYLSISLTKLLYSLISELFLLWQWLVAEAGPYWCGSSVSAWCSWGCSSHGEPPYSVCEDSAPAPVQKERLTLDRTLLHWAGEKISFHFTVAEELLNVWPLWNKWTFLYKPHLPVSGCTVYECVFSLYPSRVGTYEYEHTSGSNCQWIDECILRKLVVIGYILVF